MKGRPLSRREFLKASAASGAGLLLAACGGAAPTENPATAPSATQATAATLAPTEDILIRLMDFQGGSANYVPAFEAIFALYQQAHPNVQFERRGLGFDEYLAALQPMLASGDLPDLVGIYGGPDIQSAASAGLVISLQPYLDADPEWKARLEKVIKDDFGILGTDGQVYQLPMDAYHLNVAYYKDLLDAEGLTVWKDVDQFLAVARPLRDKDIYFWSAGAGDQGYQKETFNIAVAMQTGNVDMVLQAERGEISWQNDVFLAALKAIQATIVDVVAPENLSIDAGTAQQMFFDKQFWGQWYAGQWLAGEFVRNVPEDVDSGNVQLANFPTPTPEANAGIYGGGGGQNYSIAANSQHQDVALDFLKFLSTTEVCQILASHDIQPAAPLEDAASYTENPMLKVLISAFSSAEALVPVSSLVPDVLTRFKENIGKTMLGQLEPEAFLADMDSQFLK